LLEHVRTRPNIVVRFGWRVEDFDDDGDGVTLNAVCERNGKREIWRSAFLAGCDGGQGMVRRQISRLPLRSHTALSVTPSPSSSKSSTRQPNRTAMFGRVRTCSSKNFSTYIWLARCSGSGT